MDGVDLKETDSDFDLESAETDTTSGEDLSTDSDSSDKQPKKLMGRLQSGRLRFNGSTRDCDRIGSSKNVSGSDEDLDVKAEERRTKEKHRKTSSKKHPKPPRPPRGPSLNAADMKLVEEISEHARLRRARRQRIKELKENRADKVSSPNINLIAMAVTIIFCFVIILQGKDTSAYWGYVSCFRVTLQGEDNCIGIFVF